jgi:heme-degrading monooxygenase HmoA
MSKSITTLAFFRYSTWYGRVWAFFQMQLAHAHLRSVEGLSFYKLMGSGREMGFNPAPDWSVYALVAVWEDATFAHHFWDHAALARRFRANSTEQWVLYMKVREVKGLWSGGNPFEKSAHLDEGNPLLAVITRATIKPRRLIDFWRYVPTSQRPIAAGCDGLIFTKGIGEAPLLQMATFSLWRDFDALKKFAYQSPEHRVAIEKTKQLGWYKEEMFARFQPYRSDGIWGGKDPLADYLAG